jgi:hypothetical protein
MVSPSKSKKKNVSLTIRQKLEVLHLLRDELATRREIIKSYGCDASTVCRIVKEEAKIRDLAVRNGNLKSTRKKRSSHEDLNSALSSWFHEKRAKGTIITGPMISEQATIMAQLMNVEFKV